MAKLHNGAFAHADYSLLAEAAETESGILIYRNDPIFKNLVGS